MAEISEEVRNGLSEALRVGNEADAEALTRQALEEGSDPLSVIQEVIVPTLTAVGQDFQDFKIFCQITSKYFLHYSCLYSTFLD